MRRWYSASGWISGLMLWHVPLVLPESPTLTRGLPTSRYGQSASSAPLLPRSIALVPLAHCRATSRLSLCLPHCSSSPGTVQVWRCYAPHSLMLFFCSLTTRWPCLRPQISPLTSNLEVAALERVPAPTPFLRRTCQTMQSSKGLWN